MIRREFIKKGAMATGGLVFAPPFRGSHCEESSPDPQAASALREIPDLDELAGDWMPGNLLDQTPALSNFHGSLESSRNVLGVQSFTVPPLAQGGELGALSLNGVTLAATDFRWYPYQLQRRTTLGNVSVVTTLRMPFEQCGFLFAVEVKNTASTACAASLTISRRAAIRQYPGKWTWETPRPGDKDLGDFQLGAMRVDDGDLFYTKDTRSQSAAGFLFLQSPDQAAPSSSTATWNLTISSGETFTLRGIVAAGPELESVAHRAAGWKASFARTWDEAQVLWQERYMAAFDPKNQHFSGNLPTLVTSDAVIRTLYYSSILSLLCLERTNLSARYPRVFVTASPRWATTLVYFWDTSFFATLWALLDPVSMKQQLSLFLASNIHSCYAIDFQTMATVGPWYSANDYSIFQLVNTYVVTTGDRQFLDETVGGNKKVIDFLQELSLYWKTLTKPPSLLADYGDASNLLETVPTYIHRVPSMNAANVWMMRTLAHIRAERGEDDHARELNRLADQLAEEVLGLYVEGKGFWNCELPDSKKVEVRHCIDFFTTIAAMENELGPRRIEEMVSFVDRELWTPHWLYALSPLDGAAKESLRPDHGSTGAYDAWPALTAEALFKTGRKSEAVQRLRSVEAATWEGPFGQAHYVATDAYPVRKALDLQDYFESASGSFAEVIVRTLFGLSAAGREDLSRGAIVAGFDGSLTNLRYRGKLVTIAARAE